MATQRTTGRSPAGYDEETFTWDAQGSRMDACINTYWAPRFREGRAHSTLNVLQPGPRLLYRREYESRQYRGQMVATMAKVREMARNAAIRLAKQRGHGAVRITHES